jgi:hypothetical protein
MRTGAAATVFHGMKMTTAPIEPTQRKAARVVGILYLLQMATGVFGEIFVRGRLMVGGDATRTAQNIMADERLFRLSVAGDLLTYISVIVLIWAFYILVRPIDRSLALLALFFRLVENAILCISTACSMVVLSLLSGADYLKTFDARQLHTLASLLLAAQGLAMSVAFVLLGIGSAVFAYLLLKSGYVPKAIAAWGIFASLLLAVGTLFIIVFPAIGGVAGMAYMAPMGLYEVGLGLWLVVKGIRPPLAN